MILGGFARATMLVKIMRFRYCHRRADPGKSRPRIDEGRDYRFPTKEGGGAFAAQGGKIAVRVGGNHDGR